jgi:hypothetical protein
MLASQGPAIIILILRFDRFLKQYRSRSEPLLRRSHSWSEIYQLLAVAVAVAAARTTRCFRAVSFTGCGRAWRCPDQDICVRSGSPLARGARAPVARPRHGHVGRKKIRWIQYPSSLPCTPTHIKCHVSTERNGCLCLIVLLTPPLPLVPRGQVQFQSAKLPSTVVAVRSIRRPRGSHLTYVCTTPHVHTVSTKFSSHSLDRFGPTYELCG